MFSGSLVAIVTPMRPDGAVDFDAWGRLIDFHARAGTSGIVVGGTTGESATLTDAELGELTQRACTLARGRMAVIAGAGTSSTAATVARVRWLSSLPVDGLLVVTPAYNRPSQEGLYQHFAAAAAASARPLLLYNVPARTAVDMKPATVARLSQLAGIAGIKEAVPAGARGVISVTANVAPRAMSEMVAAALAGDAGRALALDKPLAGLHRDLFLEANPIPVKWLLMQMGLVPAGIRLPLTPLAEECRAAVHSAARAAGILG